MNRKLLTALCAVTAAATLFGCSNGGSSSTPSSSTPASSTPSASTPEVVEATYPIVKDKLTISGIAIGNSLDNGKPRQTWLKLAEVTNIEVDWDFLEFDAAATYFATNQYADLITYGSGIPNEFMADYGILGHRFVDFNNYLDYMPNLVQAFEDYPTAKKVCTETDGSIYQLPYIGNDCTAVTARMHYRIDTLNAAGCEVPATTEEFYNVLKTLKEYNNGAAPLAEDRMEFLWASFGPGKNPDFEDDGTGKVIYNRTSDQYKLYLEYMAKLYSEGLLHQEYLTLDNDAKTALARESKTVFGYAGFAALSEQDFASGKVEIDQLTPLTSEYDDKREVIGWNYARPCGVAINAKSEYIPEICRMMDVSYATSEVVEGSGLYGVSFCYGIENVNWKWSNDDHTEYELILPEELVGVKSFGAYQGEDLIYFNIGRFDTFKDATTSTEGNNKARQQGFVKNLIPYQEKVAFPGSYLKFTDDEQSVLSNKWTSISEYVNQSLAEFITGVRSVDTDWDAYVSQISAMGIDDVLAAYQAAYDRFNQ